MSDGKNWLLYGANGYTGSLIARQAARAGQRPILAGRNAAAIAALASELGCPSRCFSPDDVPTDLAAALEGAGTVLNCAGPFARTAQPLIAACVAARVNYLDITGEIDVIELAARHHDHARHAGIALMPAVGFDVVPTDCLAALLAERLPEASRLELAFAMEGRASRGTAKTVLAAMPTGGRARIDGRIERVATAWKSQRIAFADRPRWGVTIPWGDVSSAYHTTKIPNIEVYTAMPRAAIAALRLFRGPLKMLGSPAIARLATRLIDRGPPGPDAAALERDRCHLWGRVTDRVGRQVSATLETPGGYALTVLTALAAVERVQGGAVAAGFHTPAGAFGGRFIREFPDTSFRVQGDGAA
ncbi:MAG TPA: saccharopine dehydrogenase NADP-binding domain-containing protein [Pirellulales bacterium]|nr:saccharopine dehydrogenase NADP-binding domain-containing protein [Pirellulales bacterium]